MQEKQSVHDKCSMFEERLNQKSDELLRVRNEFYEDVEAKKVFMIL